jgi:hypothetical protein
MPYGHLRNHVLLTPVSRCDYHVAPSETGRKVSRIMTKGALASEATDTLRRSQALHEAKLANASRSYCFCIRDRSSRLPTRSLGSLARFPPPKPNPLPGGGRLLASQPAALLTAGGRLGGWGGWGGEKWGGEAGF